jgi:2'-5' RNA ligase
MRLFVAIDVPEKVKEHLVFLQRSLSNHALRFVHPKSMHMTLYFFGDVPHERLIVEKLKSIAFSPFTLKLSGTGFFPHEKDPKVIWVGLEEQNNIIALQQRISELFEPKKDFKPHLTLARTGTKRFDSTLLRANVTNLEVKLLSFKVSSFKLYRSTLTSLGPVYEVLETYAAKE